VVKFFLRVFYFIETLLQAEPFEVPDEEHRKNAKENSDYVIDSYLA
jgi:hypothetical protein